MLDSEKAKGVMLTSRYEQFPAAVLVSMTTSFTSFNYLNSYLKLYNFAWLVDNFTTLEVYGHLFYSKIGFYDANAAFRTNVPTVENILDIIQDMGTTWSSTRIPSAICFLALSSTVSSDVGVGFSLFNFIKIFTCYIYDIISYK